ncbi:MAG TPA: outer membrane beta-barrel protein [Allosphingosinicella sp.]|jgi:outer membrane immunogenic protein
MKKIAIILAGASTLAATPAFAQISVSPRVEVRVGLDHLNARVRLDDSAFIEDTSQGDIGVGIEAGIDASITERISIGAYAGYEIPNINGCGEEFLFDGDEICVRNNRNITVGGRLGVNVGEGGMIYAKGGYSQTRARLTYTIDGDEEFAGRDTTGGYHIGAGFEVPVSGGFYIKGEYVHTRYNNILEDELADTDSINPYRHQILAGFGIRFGGSR